jgi:hypothetical protein
MNEAELHDVELQLIVTTLPGSDPVEAAAELQSRLARLGDVDAVEAEANDKLVRLDVVEAANSVTAVVSAVAVSGGAIAVLLDEIRHVIESARQLGQAVIRTPDGRNVLLDEVAADELTGG